MPIKPTKGIRKYLLSPMIGGDDPFQVIEKINDNAYKLDLPSEYQISTTFNAIDLSLFNVGDELDLRTNLFEEGGADGKFDKSNNLQDPLQGLEDPLTRARVKVKRVKETLQCLVKNVQAKEDLAELESNFRIITFLHLEDNLDPT
ncbi:hypothetical protein CR513_23832, partial [Mucuna pruriens]